MVVVAESYGYSGHSNDIYKIYNVEHDMEFAFTDNQGSLFNERRGGNKIIPHMIAYMEQHHDSILIWYHPKAEIKYARDTDTAVSDGGRCHLSDYPRPACCRGRLAYPMADSV